MLSLILDIGDDFIRWSTPDGAAGEIPRGTKTMFSNGVVRYSGEPVPHQDGTYWVADWMEWAWARGLLAGLPWTGPWAGIGGAITMFTDAVGDLGESKPGIPTRCRAHVTMSWRPRTPRITDEPSV